MDKFFKGGNIIFDKFTHEPFQLGKGLTTDNLTFKDTGGYLLLIKSDKSYESYQKIRPISPNGNDPLVSKEEIDKAYEIAIESGKLAELNEYVYTKEVDLFGRIVDMPHDPRDIIENPYDTGKVLKLEKKENEIVPVSPEAKRYFNKGFEIIYENTNGSFIAVKRGAVDDDNNSGNVIVFVNETKDGTDEEIFKFIEENENCIQNTFDENLRLIESVENTIKSGTHN